MNNTTQKALYPASSMNSSQKESLALDALSAIKSISQLARDKKVSRQFVYKQKTKALDAINATYKANTISQDDDKVLFHLPVTTPWLSQFVVSLTLDCRANIRGIQKVLMHVFDYSLSFGSIHHIIDEAKSKAKRINDMQELSQIKLAAEDEMFHYNKPVLTGIDIPSLYCYLLSDEQHRDSDTWGVHLLDLKKQGLEPDRIISDDADSIRAANQYVYPEMPCDIDNFHIIRDMMNLRRYFRNSLKSAITYRQSMQSKVDKAIITIKMDTYHEQLGTAKEKEKSIQYLSSAIDTLVDWMQHDVLNMPGLEPASRYMLFDFILEELNSLAAIHPHRIAAICTTLKNQKYYLLAFTEVLNEKFQMIADRFIFPLDKIWEMCALQRCQHGGDKYAIRSLPLVDYFQSEFDEVEDAVIEALNTTERTSSMVENLHSRLKPYFYLRREIGFGYLDLLRLYLNHTPFLRSEKEERRGKTPAQILTGKSHPHWLEMLGYQRFKRAA